MEEENEKRVFNEELEELRDRIEEWPISKLKKEASDDSGNEQTQVRDDIGIE